MSGGVADRAVERAVEAAKSRARDDVELLISAGLAVLRREGAADMTIADVLSEAGLSTRAFYRHFTSKSDLLLAIYEHEVNLYSPRLQSRLDAAGSPTDALIAWIDELLATGFQPSRGPRTRAMFSWAMPLQQEFPTEFAAIRAAFERSARGDPRRRARRRILPHDAPRPRRAVHPRPHLGAGRRPPLRRNDRRRHRARRGAALRAPGPGRVVTIDVETDRIYYDEAAETLSRSDLDAMQLERLLLMLPHAYEHSPLVRSVWEEAGVHPRDISSLDDYRERAPFIDKETLRHWREDRGDPYAGLLCLPQDEITTILSSSGTTGEPTLSPQHWAPFVGPRPGRPVTRPLDDGHATSEIT